MRIIAITKNCLDHEKELILSSVEKDDRVAFFSDEQEFLRSEIYEEAEIILGEPDLDTVRAMKKLRWIQMTWAGANKYTSSPDLFTNITLTSASGAYGHVISEYIISGLLALYRNLFIYRSQMQEGMWKRIESEDTLEGKRVLVLGTGDIGEETAKKLRCFGAYTLGVCRTGRDVSQPFDEIHTVGSLDTLLPHADIVVVALPGTAETSGMFDAERFGRMKPGAVFVNVGRGFIADTQALTDALRDGTLGGAVLDVTDPEPLPGDHPLRNMENVMLTPHISGIGWGTNMFTRKRILEIFCENIRRDNARNPLRNIIDFGKGY